MIALKLYWQYLLIWIVRIYFQDMAIISWMEMKPSMHYGYAIVLYSHSVDFNYQGMEELLKLQRLIDWSLKGSCL